MRKPAPSQVRQVWLKLEEADARQVVEQFRQTIKEMINEHFRISPISTSRPQGDDLRPTVESQPGYHQQGKPAHAVRAA